MFINTPKTEKTKPTLPSLQKKGDHLFLSTIENFDVMTTT